MHGLANFLQQIADLCKLDQTQQIKLSAFVWTRIDNIPIHVTPCTRLHYCGVEASHHWEEVMKAVSISVALAATGLAFAASEAQAAGSLNLICSADVVICEQMTADFEKESGIKVNMVRLSS
ncbi:MAG: hypothetical protein AAAB36_31955, partial [Ensifer adhaerens]